jgi:hypothetical protein
MTKATELGYKYVMCEGDAPSESFLHVSLGY